MKRIVATLIIYIGLTAVLSAQEITAFSTGTPINASVMNTNFNNIKSTIAAMQSAITALQSQVTALETKPVSLATNGYLDLQGGLTIQWGNATGVATQGLTVITFPKAFANGILYAGASTVGGNNTVNTYAYDTPTKTTVRFIRGNWSTENNSTSFNWVAIGY